MKEIPILFENKEDCCGCSACFAICPGQAIEMKTDDAGFEYPEINGEKCIGCGSCVGVCPVKIEDKNLM